MMLGAPVIAISNGGPKETVVHGRTGYLLENDSRSWGEHMRILATDHQARQEWGQASIAHVTKHFGFEKFCRDLDRILTNFIFTKDGLIPN